MSDTGEVTAVELVGLTKSYGRTRATEDIDLSIAPGEVVALLGPNGAGKSTTIDMLLGLTRPDHGTARIFGQHPAEAVRSGRVGAMLQDGQLPPDLTVRELLVLVAGLHQAPQPVADALDRAGIADLARRRAGKLSGGQTQRVRFALAGVSSPELLVLDEPTAGMDVGSRLTFWESMRAQADAGRTVLFATHYLEEADEHADRIVVIRQGRVVADGSTTEIKSIVTERVVRATLAGADAHALEALPGVEAATVRGESVELRCSDSDSTLRALFTTFPAVCDIEVTGAGLTDAFVALTGSAAAADGTRPRSRRAEGVQS